MKKAYSLFALVLVSAITLSSCNCGNSAKTTFTQDINTGEISSSEIKMDVKAIKNEAGKLKSAQITIDLMGIKGEKGGFIAFDVDVPVAGRYQTQIHATNNTEKEVICWVEDYYDNTDDRTYNATGNLVFEANATEKTNKSVDGSPLNKGIHKMKIHFNEPILLDKLVFDLMKEHDITPVHMTQTMDGTEWNIVWADEFDGPEIDTSKWTYDIGDWGWGNFEAQYYTKDRKENARIEDGNLIIEAHKNKVGDKWTSARLTTRGKVSFKYGKIEFRAKVPVERGNWSAGWTLGDSYIDEIDWPYCGEIDIMESVGFEMEDSTGNGVAHASVHSRAAYFKIGNQATAVQNLKNMNKEYHTYAVEWTPDYIYILVDDDHYFTYEKTDIKNSWPYDIPQNIILNLAMGGGWGGAQGMDESITKQTMIIDYVRVFEKK